jgi:hypothetical protein
MTRLQTLAALALLLLVTNVLTVLNADFRDGFLEIMKQTIGRVVPLPSPESSRLQEEIGLLKAENRSLVQKSDTLRVATVALVGATQALVVAETVLRARHAALQTKEQVQRGAARRFKEIVISRVKRTALRGSATLIARATPVAGIAASAAVLSFDLVDACEVLEEAQKVGNVFGDEERIAHQICGLKVPSVNELRSMVPL